MAMPDSSAILAFARAVGEIMKSAIHLVGAVKILLIGWLAGLFPHSDCKGQGQSVGVNFIGAAGASGTLAATDLTGIPDVAQKFWNNAGGSFGSLANLTDSSGQQSAISAAWRDLSGVGDTGAAQTGNDFRLMRGFLAASVAGNGIEFSDIPYPIYDLVVYMSGPPTSSSSGNLFYRSPNFDTYPPAAERHSPLVMYSPVFDGNFVEATPTTAGNYYVFHDLTYRDIAVGSIYFPLSAVQLVAVPEPSAGVLALLTATLFTFLSRRKAR